MYRQYRLIRVLLYWKNPVLSILKHLFSNHTNTFFPIHKFLGPCPISGYYPVSGTIWQFLSYPVSGRIACVSGGIYFFNLYIFTMNEPNYNYYLGKMIEKRILTLFCLWSSEIIIFLNIDILSLYIMLKPFPKVTKQKCKCDAWSKKCFKRKQGSEAGYSVGPHSGRLVLLWSTMKIWIVN